MWRRTGELLFIAVSLALVGWAIVWVPTLFGHADGVLSAAQHEGYNNRAAHLVALVWIAAVVLGVYAIARGEAVPDRDTDDIEQGRAGSHRLILPLLTVLGVVVLYFPPALAWTGALIEENIHLTNIHRMMAGDVPYADFEFLYGPLMLYPAYYWMTYIGFSLTTFYSYVLVLELLVMLLILSRVQHYIPGFAARVGAFLILASLYFNVLMGPNQNGLRKLWGVLILINLAQRPFHPLTWAINGVLLGLLMAYSQDFGGGTAIGVTAIYASLFFKLRNVRAIVGLVLTGGLSLAVWLGTLFYLLGDAMGDYFSTLSYLTGQFDSGEAAFQFYWTLNSAAVFGLVALAAWAVGRTLARPWDEMPGAGALLMIGGLAYAALLLKSGLSRTDQWHIDPVVLVIIFALLLPFGERVASLPRPARLVGIALSIVLAVTYTFGQFRIARYVFLEGLVPGYVGLLREDRQVLDKADTVLPAAVYMTGQADPQWVALTEFLASPPMQSRAVMPYDDEWNAPYRVGVHKAGYLTDSYIYGDQRGLDLRAMLEADPTVLVLMSRGAYDWLLQGPDAETEKPGLNLAGFGRNRELRAILSSPHIPGSFIEEQQKDERWRRTVGLYVVETYSPVYTSDRFVVLDRSAE